MTCLNALKRIYKLLTNMFHITGSRLSYNSHVSVS
nr:MAG TPA: hypothetical protein [Bacteriophage sp.]